MDFSNEASATFTVGLLPVTKLTNTVLSVSATDDFTLTKEQSQTVLFPDTIQEYTITGENQTGVGVTVFTLVDVIPAGLSYIVGSFKVDGVVTAPTTVIGNTLTYIFGAWANGDTHTFSFQCERS